MCTSSFQRYPSQVRNKLEPTCSTKCAGVKLSEKSLGEHNPNWRGRSIPCYCGEMKDPRALRCSRCAKVGFPVGRPKDQRSKQTYKQKHVARFGLTWTEYEEMLKKQNYTCAICPRTQEEEGRALAIDHDHTCCPQNGSCGKCVRGLLCFQCNKRLEGVDDPTFLASALTYLKRTDKL